MTSSWFEDFFQGMALDIWRNAIPPEQTRAEAEFLAAVLAAKAGAHLLDVPCGNGRLAFALAASGLRITGVDLSKEFIAEAEAREAESQEAEAREAESQEEGGAMQWLRGDMRELPWRETFDGAYCFGNSFAYFPREDCCVFFAAIQRTLKPGARFVLDTALTAESLLPELEERTWSPVGDMILLVERQYVVAESRLDTEYTFIAKGKSESRRARYWIFTVAEIGRMLQESGLEPISMFCSLDQEPYRFGAPRLLLVAEKQAAEKK